jgi:transposase
MSRIAELEARLSAPPKTPDNSSTPPSKGQKANLPDRVKQRRGGRRGASRALSEHPDRIIEATLSTCPHCAHALGSADQPEIHAYDHIELPAITPTVTPASTAIAASVPAAAGGSQRRRRTGSSLARRSGRDCAR